METIEDLKLFGLQLFQPRLGYRYSLDALLLARFCQGVKQGGRIVDLGAGCGIIALLLARANPGVSVAAVENNPEMAALVERNIRHNDLAERVVVHAEDVMALRRRYPDSSFDLVVSNPPFRKQGSGRISPRAGRDAARHETTAALADFMTVAKYLVKPGGRICFIQHPSRLTDFIAHAGELNLALHRLRMVHDRVTAPATMFLAELAKGSRATVEILPPLVIRDESGEYSRETREILGEGQKGHPAAAPNALYSHQFRNPVVQSLLDQQNHLHHVTADDMNREAKRRAAVRNRQAVRRGVNRDGGGDGDDDPHL